MPSPTDSGAVTPADAGPTFHFAPEIVASGCAKALACMNGSGSVTGSIGHCVDVLSRIGVLDLERYSWLLSIWDDYDWSMDIALMQNMACVQAASGCPAILACLNQGQARTACSVPANYSRHRRCDDARHLRGCAFGIDTVFDCGELGFECVDLTGSGTDSVLATCGTRVASGRPIDTVVPVTCQGDLSTVELGDGAYLFDCDYLGATCVPGSYDLNQDFAWCMGKRAATCDTSSFQQHCDGDALVVCLDGHEGLWNCPSWGTTCDLAGPASSVACQFDCASTPESCTAGVVSYCGPKGMTTLDCTSLGFSGCQTDSVADPAEAWCVP
jgi:hypothetical protein